MKLECHCKNVSIEVDSMPERLTMCNCSICHRYSSLWGYYPPDSVKVTVGDDDLKAYIWGDRELEFHHCTHCGCVTHYTTKQGLPDPRIAVNFRMAEPSEIKIIPIREFDGASM